MLRTQFMSQDRNQRRALERSGDPIKGGSFLDLLNDYWLLKKDCVARSCLTTDMLTFFRVTGKEGKAVPVLFLTEHHATKAYWGSGGIAPLILDLGTRWR
jgi:hypothetical protein